MSIALADTVLTTVLDLLAAAAKLTALKASKDAAGLPITLEDLKDARAADDVAAAELDAAIKVHGG